MKPLAVSMGEPAGIGPDLILSLFADRAHHKLPPLLIFGNAAFLRSRASRLNLSFEIHSVEVNTAFDAENDVLHVVNCGDECADAPGRATTASAPLVINAIKCAVDAVTDARCGALVTAPINKAVLQDAGFAHPGHTEYLAHLATRDGHTPAVLMMLATQNLRTVPLTIHIPLAAVPPLVTTYRVEQSVTLLRAELIDKFGLVNPKIAVTGLNPHAGEDGHMGHEDKQEIVPAISNLRALGFDVTGPLPADTAFSQRNWQQFDAILAMYHDQALIPIKTLAFDEAVNITLGLPFVRTSPDHGTAFELAGKSEAKTDSMLAAIRCAQDMSMRQLARA